MLATLRRERLVRVERGVGTVVRGPERGPERSREQIVQAAVAMADDEGLAGLLPRFLTLARLSAAAAVDLSLGALFDSGLRCFLDGLEVRAARGAWHPRG